MKQLTVLAAATAMTWSAQAQTTLRIFGIVDTAITRASNRAEDAGSPWRSTVQSSTQMTSSGMQNSRIGFNGKEDLGAGMSVGFWLEARLNSDDGSGITGFSQRSTVSLHSGLGELRLGRDYTPVFVNDVLVEPFNFRGAGAALTFIANSGSPLDRVSRASNSIGYFLPPGLGGLYGQAMYAFDETLAPEAGSSTAASRTGKHVGARLGYAVGKLDVALALGRTTSGRNPVTGINDRVDLVSLGATYDFGLARLHAGVNRSKGRRSEASVPAAARPDVRLDSFLLGVSVPAGTGVLRGSYSRAAYDYRLAGDASSPGASKWSVGYVHKLSRRTALYVTAARIRNRDGAALTVGGPAYQRGSAFTPTSSTGYDIGVRHSF